MPEVTPKWNQRCSKAFQIHTKIPPQKLPKKCYWPCCIANHPIALRLQDNLLRRKVHATESSGFIYWHAHNIVYWPLEILQSIDSLIYMGAAASIEGYVSLSLDSIIFLLSCLIYLLLNALALSSFRSKPIDASDLRSLTLQESKAEIMRLRAELGHLGNYYDLD